MPPTTDDFVYAWTTGSLPEAYLLKGRLEADGIPVLLKGEGEGPYRMAPAELWVPASLEVQARMILEAARAEADEASTDDEDEDEDDG